MQRMSMNAMPELHDQLLHLHPGGSSSAENGSSISRICGSITRTGHCHTPAAARPTADGDICPGDRSARPLESFSACWRRLRGPSPVVDLEAEHRPSTVRCGKNCIAGKSCPVAPPCTAFPDKDSPPWLEKSRNQIQRAFAHPEGLRCDEFPRSGLSGCGRKCLEGREGVKTHVTWRNSPRVRFRICLWL